MQLTESVQMTNALPSKWVAHLMVKMQAMYGAKFSQQWQGIDPDVLQNEWAEMLAGYTGDELKRGLNACLTRTFPPTLPEFMVLCRPPINHQVAFHDAVQGLIARRNGDRGEWSHPAIFHAALKVGQYDMLNGAYQTLRGRWDSALNDQMAAHEWAPIPDALKLLAEPARTDLSNTEAKAAMKKLGAADVVNRSGRDHRAWIATILDNPKKKYSYASVRMATSAREATA